MNEGQLKKREWKLHRLRPLPIRLSEHGEKLEDMEDFWSLTKLDGKFVHLTNDTTGRTAIVGYDSVREFREPDFLLLRCQIFIQGDRVFLEPT